MISTLLARKPKADTTIQLSEQSPKETATSSELVKCLEHFIDHNVADMVGISARERELLEKLCERLKASDNTALRGAVNASMTASKVQAGLANAFSDISDVRQHSQIMAGAIQELDSSISQISISAQSIDQGLQSSADETRLSAEEVDQATASVRNTTASLEHIVGNMQELENAATQIRGMSKTIEDIAGQTNLLALNATIEAARAGDAGRGFAVVASEVKSLSDQTAKTTEQIAERIQNLESAIEMIVGAVTSAQTSARDAEEITNSANHRVQNTTQSILNNADAVSALANVINDQKAATAELARGVDQVANQSQSAQSKLEATTKIASESENQITAQFDELEKRKVANYVLYRAKSDHMIWKKRLAALLSGLSELSEHELADHHSCRLGKWWDGEIGNEISSLASFKAIEAPHRAVHASGRRAAELYNRGDKAGAQQAYLEMERASEDVIQRLDELISKLEAKA